MGALRQREPRDCLAQVNTRIRAAEMRQVPHEMLPLFMKAFRVRH